MSRSVGLVVALVVLVATGCSPDTTASPTPAGSRQPVAVCGLVADVEAALGRAPIESPSTYTVGENDRCMWVVGRDPSRYIGLTVGPKGNHETTIAALGPGEAVAGLGDGAVWWGNARTLSVVDGEAAFQVDLQLDDAEATREVATGVAQQVVDALGAPPPS
jgi:hypothetical protein